MKYVVGFILALATSMSQASPASWRLSEVESATNETVGYIYHSYSIGTQKSPNKTEKIVSGLRFICSIQGEDNPPMIGIYWHDVSNTDSVQNPVWTIDGNTIQTGPWIQDETLLYRPVGITLEVINALKVGKQASVTWTDSKHLIHRTIFDLTGFSAGLVRFNTDCGTSI